MISTTKVIGRLTITVEFYNQIAASIRPLVNEDGTPDEGAIAEYEEFILCDIKPKCFSFQDVSHMLCTSRLNGFFVKSIAKS